MVKPIKKETYAEAAERRREEYNKSHPLVREGYWVTEYTPGYNTGGYYDEDIPPKEVTVSNEFKTYEEAVEWRDQHEPDEGNVLYIRRRELRRQPIQHRWGPLTRTDNEDRHPPLFR